jgi:hypothetical protein
LEKGTLEPRTSPLLHGDVNVIAATVRPIRALEIRYMAMAIIQRKTVIPPRDEELVELKNDVSCVLVSNPIQN